ncbi:MAG TPA: hypothetical protein VK902_13655 [Rubrobacter sp.]|nr:hypothetical protein [Rubrobacter sp.]
MIVREDPTGRYDERARASEEGARTPGSKISRRSEWDESILGQLRASLRSKSLPELQTPEQREALARVVSALDDYAHYFYPTDPRR